MDTVDLEELLDSRERTGALVLWLSFDGQRNVLELFSDNSYLSAILDRQGLLVAAQKETLEPRRLGNFSSQQLQVFWSKLKKKSPKIVVMSPTATAKNSEHKEVLWQKSLARVSLFV